MIAIELLIGSALLGLVCAGAYLYAKFWMKFFLHKDNDDMQYILETSAIPDDWIKKYTKKLTKLESKSADAQKLERVRQESRRAALKRMKRIIAFSKGAPVFESDAQRKNATATLNQIVEMWKRGED